LPIRPGQAFKPVPLNDVPIILFEAKGHLMQSTEDTWLFRPNIIHSATLPVDTNMPGTKALFKDDPTPGRAHQFFLLDDAVVKVIVEQALPKIKEYLREDKA
jgi:hypothetical protein